MKKLNYSLLAIVIPLMLWGFNSCNPKSEVQALNQNGSGGTGGPGGTPIVAKPAYLTVTSNNGGIVNKNQPDTVTIATDAQFINVPTSVQKIPGTNMYIIKDVTDGLTLPFSAFNKSADGSTMSELVSKSITLQTYDKDQSYLSWDSARHCYAKWKMLTYTITVVSTGAMTNGTLDNNVYMYQTPTLRQVIIPGSGVGTDGYQLLNPGDTNMKINFGYTTSPPNTWGIGLLNDNIMHISQRKTDTDGIERIRIQEFGKIL